MARWLIVLVAASAAILLVTWALLFSTRTGILISDDLYMVSDAHGYAFDPTAGATDTPVGRVCLYLTHAGLTRVGLIERSAYADIMRARGNVRDPQFERILFVESWPANACRPTFDFTERFAI